MVGEVVFTTGVTGFQETLTDPSYFGQIVTQTFPLIGNYGVNGEDDESNDTYLSGYIIREWCNAPSNFRCTGNVNEFLIAHNVVGIHNIDTRCLTRIIREAGVMNGVITTEDVYAKKDELMKQIKAYSIKDAVKTVSDTSIRVYGDENAKYTIALFDFGYKRNIRRMLLNHDCKVIVVPAETTAEQIRELDPDGIMLSNGPGNPEENTVVIENLKEICKLGIPMLGICLGHQLMALAHGGRTEKLKYGHRGANQPVIDLDLNRTFVTSQNHGYAVVAESLDPSVAVITHINGNDKTCEGVRYLDCNARTVQFHPEARGGPLDTTYLFDEFTDKIEKYKEERANAAEK